MASRKTNQRYSYTQKRLELDESGASVQVHWGAWKERRDPNLHVIQESMPRHILEAAPPSQRETVIG
jgi:hypothetical protein